MDSNILISVIIPTYKRSEFLARAIESVLKDNYPHKEIIVVDDNGIGPQQEITKTIVAKYTAVKLKVYEKNQGACFARNIGAEIAKGEILMFLDDDDYFLPGKIWQHAQPLLSNNNVDMALCSLNIVDEQGNKLENSQKYPKGESFTSFVLNGHVFTDMIAIRKHVFESLGGFDDIPRFQDKYFMYNFFKANKTVHLVNKELVVWTDHNELRISSKNMQNEVVGLEIIHSYEKANFLFFTKKEQLFLTDRFYRNMAETKLSSGFFDRVTGLGYLIKCRWLGNEYAIVQFKLLLQLLLSNKFFSKIKQLKAIKW